VIAFVFSMSQMRNTVVVNVRVCFYDVKLVNKYKSLCHVCGCHIVFFFLVATHGHSTGTKTNKRDSGERKCKSRRDREASSSRLICGQAPAACLRLAEGRRRLKMQKQKQKQNDAV